MAARWTVGLAVAGLLAVAGCGTGGSDGSAGTSTHPPTSAPVTTTATASTASTTSPTSTAPGEVLPGVAVVDGSHVLGTTFPGITSDLTGETAEDGPIFRTWTALIAVDGEPGAVFDAYAQALAAAGYGASGMNTADEPTCRYYGGDGGDALVPDAVPVSRGEEAMPIRCTLSLGSAQLDLDLTGPGHDALWSSVIVLRVDTTDGEIERGAPATVDPALLIGGRSGQLPDAGTAPATPQEGERIAPSEDWTHDPADPSNDLFPVHELTVPAGLELLSPSATTSSIGSWMTVGRTDGDPTPVMDALLEQAGSSEFGPEQDEVVDGRKVIGRSWDEAGGDKLYLTAVETDDGWFVLIATSTDP